MPRGLMLRVRKMKSIGLTSSYNRSRTGKTKKLDHFLNCKEKLPGCKPTWMCMSMGSNLQNRQRIQIRHSLPKQQQKISRINEASMVPGIVQTIMRGYIHPETVYSLHSTQVSPTRMEPLVT